MAKPQPALEKLPQNIEAERSILGAILLDNAALNVAAEKIVPADLFHDHHRRIYLACLEMQNDEKPIDLVTLCDRLATKGELESAGGAAYVSSLMDGVPHITNVAHYADIVKEKAGLRSIIKAAEFAQRQALDPTANLEQIETSWAKSFNGNGQNGNGHNGNGHGAIGSSLMDFLKMEFPPADHLVEELIPRGGSVLFVALPHRMKSIFTTALALACTVETETALGKLKVNRPVRTILVQVEDHESTVQQRITGFLSTPQFSNCHADNLWIVKRRDFPGFSKEWALRFAKQAKEWNADLIILDVLRRIFQGFGDLNSPKDSAAFLETVDEIRNITGAAVALVHHENKKDADLMNAAAGSYNFPGWANVVIQFKRKTIAGRVTHVEIEVDNKLGVSAEPMRMCLDLTSPTPVQLEGIEDGVGINEAIEGLGDTWSVRDLAEALEVNRSNAQRRLKKWRDKFLVEKVTGGKKGPHGGMARYRFITIIP
jgi:DnaB helicase-like protein/AAA domain-containing protein